MFPRNQKVPEQVDENFKSGRKRRKLRMLKVAERVGIDRTILFRIEKGNGPVSMAAYSSNHHILGLQDDPLNLADEDDCDRKLQDLRLIGY